MGGRASNAGGEKVDPGKRWISNAGEIEEVVEKDWRKGRATLLLGRTIIPPLAVANPHPPSPGPVPLDLLHHFTSSSEASSPASSSASSWSTSSTQQAASLIRRGACGSRAAA
eukprot:3220167-Pyramimonas_sp.AAC.1